MKRTQSDAEEASFRMLFLLLSASISGDCYFRQDMRGILTVWITFRYHDFSLTMICDDYLPELNDHLFL